jgi:hypothetical protein
VARHHTDAFKEYAARIPEYFIREFTALIEEEFGKSKWKEDYGSATVFWEACGGKNAWFVDLKAFKPLWSGSSSVRNFCASLLALLVQEYTL